MSDEIQTLAQEEEHIRELMAQRPDHTVPVTNDEPISAENEDRPTDQKRQDNSKKKSEPSKKEEGEDKTRKSESASEKGKDKTQLNGTEKKDGKEGEETVPRGEKRLTDKWAQLTKEKEDFSKQRDSFVSRAAQQEIDRLAAENAELKGKSEFTPAQLRIWAQENIDKSAEVSDPSQKLELKQIAQRMREKADQVEKLKAQGDQEKQQLTQRQEQSKKQFDQEWMSHLGKMQQENPDLKEGTELYHETAQILNHEDPQMGKYLRSRPDGIVLAVYLAKLRLDAEAASDLREENEQLKEKLKGRDKKLGLGKSFASVPASEKEFDSLSLPEMERSIKTQIAQGQSNYL